VKRSNLAIGFCIAVGTLFVFAATHRQVDQFENLKPYVTSDETKYWMGISSPAPGSPKEALETRTIELKLARFETVEALVKHDATAKSGWKYLPELTTVPEYRAINAYKSGSLWVPGTGVMPDDFILVKPEVTSHEFVGVAWVDGYELVETRKLSRWEVLWLKITHLGSDPFQEP
jgi:hypothetical protein